MDFGEQIKSIRKKENLTQEQFAIKLKASEYLFEISYGVRIKI